MDAEPARNDYEKDEEDDGDKKKTDDGGEQNPAATQHWTQEEAEAAQTDVREWIAR